MVTLCAIIFDTNIDKYYFVILKKSAYFNRSDGLTKAGNDEGG